MNSIMSKKRLGTKAETLKAIFGKIQNAKVLPVYELDVKLYLQNKQAQIQCVQEFFSENRLVIRSSCQAEDQFDSSGAGKFSSILNIAREDTENIQQSIDKVINSYGAINLDYEKVLIQPMLLNIIKSGVIFTCDIDTFAPYYIINYDESEQSDTITSGSKNDLKTYIYYKNNSHSPDDLHLKKLINMCKEIEQFFGHEYLDIEFAIDHRGDLYVFQVRPIVQKNKLNLSVYDLEEPLKKIYFKIKKLSHRHPNLLEERTVFGVMPDWNPAEIIGIRPKKLAISLYKELVTDSIWAYQRNDYGYRDLRSHPLMVSFLGVPFIDVRVTFNSFIPKNLNDEIAEKLVNYYIDRLVQIPSYHDKVEFEIVYSCYYLNLSDHLKRLAEFGFSEHEIKRIEFSLLELTNQIIHPETGLYKKDLLKNKILEQKYSSIIHSDLTLVDKIYWLIEDCKTYGTLPFAGIARAAFIAVQFLRSFVELGIITEKECNDFMNGLCTINKEMSRDLHSVHMGRLERRIFIEKYGHIRPGTYDILSKRYDEDFEQYFSALASGHTYDKGIMCFSDRQLNEINEALRLNGVRVNAVELLQFIKEAIEGREYAKFIFTRSLSKALQLIEEYGNRNDISREDLAFLDYAQMKELYSTLDHRHVKDIFEADINKNRAFYQYTMLVKLPSIILKPEDVYEYFLLEEEPNFVTLKRVVAAVVVENELHNQCLEGKIVCISSADPGYDFLFTKNISGLVTQYGGANSHMAIRCAELGIPAVIGVGESSYNKCKNTEVIEIDALNKKLRCIDSMDMV